MNATTLLKSVLKTKGTLPRTTARIESMVSTAVRRELNALANPIRKLSRPMDPATAEHLRIQGIRARKWAR